jgi:hypothetical protein
MPSLGRKPSQTWHSIASNAENKWPDAWWSVCHVAYLRENQWNQKNEEDIEARLFCHKCYEECFALGKCIDVPDYEIHGGSFGPTPKGGYPINEKTARLSP